MTLFSERDELSESVSQLHLQTGNTKKQQQPKKKPKQEPVADSWEDESLSSSDSDPEEKESATEDDKTAKAAPPDPPPPTPTSPAARKDPGRIPAWPQGPTSPVGSGTLDRSEKRPEKTDAVARRMIAGALGMRAPKMTEEQRAYDKAVKEQERARREKQKEEERTRQEEAEKARAAIWDN